MTLRDSFVDDLPVFVDISEFAEDRTIDGKANIPCVLEVATDDGQFGAGNFDVASTATLYVDGTLLVRLPQVNRGMVIDGVEYVAGAVEVEEGLMKVNLTRHGSV